MGRYDFDPKKEIAPYWLKEFGIKLYPGFKASLVPTEVTHEFSQFWITLHLLTGRMDAEYRPHLQSHSYEYFVSFTSHDMI